MGLILTEKAELRLRAFLQGTADQTAPQKGVRIGVTDGGCSGYQYTLDIIKAPQADDLVVEQGRVKVYIDPQSAPLLEGVLVDYVEGLFESGFKFSNPNATSTCGCGQSFQAGDCTPVGTPCH